LLIQNTEFSGPSEGRITLNYLYANLLIAGTVLDIKTLQLLNHQNQLFELTIIPRGRGDSHVKRQGMLIIEKLGFNL